jgi:peptidoglycan/xylan/chitin deacetylase (PgdA/CDA1 family)
VVYVAAGGSYSEPGYSATDNKDGNITAKVQVTGSVDTQHSGAYYKYYTVTDTAGNTAKVTRKIVVYGGNTASDYEDVKPSGKTIYLTFDDGPGAYTNQLLGYLDKYGVKATFFVTNQFPKYQYLIKTAHQQGHKIAIHTASHKWSIYKTPENYMQDFNAMQDIVTAQTGSATNIFRFPGGTNNTISRSQNKGIMTLLSKQMTDSGYFYFDWNVDSNDARYSSTQKIISDTISQISTKTNAVVLMHDIKKYSVEAVPAIIEYGLENGYTFKVLDENSPAIRFKPAN